MFTWLLVSAWLISELLAKSCENVVSCVWLEPSLPLNLVLIIVEIVEKSGHEIAALYKIIKFKLNQILKMMKINYKLRCLWKTKPKTAAILKMTITAPIINAVTAF